MPGTSPRSTTGWVDGGLVAGAGLEASVDHGHHSGMWVPGAPPTWGRMFLPHLDPWSVLAVLSVVGLLVYLAAVVRLRRSGCRGPGGGRWRGSPAACPVRRHRHLAQRLQHGAVQRAAQHMVLSLITPLLLMLGAP